MLDQPGGCYGRHDGPDDIGGERAGPTESGKCADGSVKIVERVRL
jgi:hypothetical protein